MSKSRVFLAVSALLIVALVVVAPTPASADPTGTTFAFLTNNFQLDTDPAPYDPDTAPFGPGLDSFTPAVPFGGSTFIPAAGVTVTTSVTTSPAVPGLTIGGLDFVEIVVDTFTPDDISGVSGDSGFLNASPAADSAWIVDGLSWGSAAPPGVSAFLTFLQFDRDGVIEPLTTALGIPIVPHPINGGDAIPLDTTGDSASTLPLIFSTSGLGGTLGSLLIAFGVSPATATGINSMHVSFEVIHIPEPASMMLLGTGLVALVTMRRRNR